MVDLTDSEVEGIPVHSGEVKARLLVEYGCGYLPLNTVLQGVRVEAFSDPLSFLLRQVWLELANRPADHLHPLQGCLELQVLIRVVPVIVLR